MKHFKKLIEIFNSNHQNLYFRSSFIGTGVVKNLTKLNDEKLKNQKLSDESFPY